MKGEPIGKRCLQPWGVKSFPPMCLSNRQKKKAEGNRGSVPDRRKKRKQRSKPLRKGASLDNGRKDKRQTQEKNLEG